MNDVRHVGPVPVPRWLVIGAAAVLAVNVTMIFMGGWRTGVAWDETFHVFRMRNYLSDGWYITESDFVNGRPAAWVENRYVYGPITMILLHGWSVLLGVESPGEISSTATAFAARHVGIGLISLFGVAAVASITRIILGSWKWALVSTALLTAIPLWSGHAMFNIKDLPVAVGYSCATLGLVLMTGDGLSTGIVRRILSPLSLGVGVILAVGTRPGMWTGVAASIFVLVVLEILRGMGGGGLVPALRVQVWRLAGVALGLLLAALVLGFAYPAAFANPVRPLIEAAVSSSNYRGGAQGNWRYIPTMVLTQMPLLVLALFVVGVVATAWKVKRAGWRLDVTSVRLMVVGAQIFALPILAMARQSDLYNGLRQLLFAVPGVAVVAAAGLAWVLTSETLHGSPRVIRALVACLAAGAVIFPTVEQIRLFPYNYVAYNVVADLASVQVETDYWRTSVRELAPQIPRTGRVVCSPFVMDGRALRFGFDGNDDCSESPIGPLAPYAILRTADPERPLAATEFWAVIERTGRVPTNCSRMASVARPEGLDEMTMSFVARCQLPFKKLNERVVTFQRPDAWGYLVEGWSIPHTPHGVRSTGRLAELGLRIRSRLQGGRLLVECEAERQQRIQVLVNGLPVRKTRLATGLQEMEVRIPSDTMDQYPDGSLTVQFEIIGYGQLDFALRSLRLRQQNR